MALFIELAIDFVEPEAGGICFWSLLSGLYFSLYYAFQGMFYFRFPFSSLSYSSKSLRVVVRQSKKKENQTLNHFQHHPLTLHSDHSPKRTLLPSHPPTKYTTDLVSRSSSAEVVISRYYMCLSDVGHVQR